VFLGFRPAYIAQRSLAAADMRLPAIPNRLRDTTNCRVRIVVGRPCNRFAGPAVATHESRKGGNRLVTDVGVAIRAQNLSEVSYNVGHANVLVTAPFAGETMESALTDGRDGVAQSLAKGACRCVTGVMIQKGQADAPHRYIRMAECGGLHRSDRHLLAKTRPAFLAEREPSMDKIIRDFEVSPHRCTQSGLVGLQKLAVTLPLK